LRKSLKAFVSETFYYLYATIYLFITTSNILLIAQDKPTYITQFFTVDK